MHLQFWSHAQQVSMAKKCWKCNRDQCTANFWAMHSKWAWPKNVGSATGINAPPILGPCTASEHGPKMLEVQQGSMHLQFWGHAQQVSMAQYVGSTTGINAPPILGPCTASEHGPNMSEVQYGSMHLQFWSHAQQVSMAKKCWKCNRDQCTANFGAMHSKWAWPKNVGSATGINAPPILGPCTASEHGQKMLEMQQGSMHLQFWGHAQQVSMAKKCWKCNRDQCTSNFGAMHSK